MLKTIRLFLAICLVAFTLSAADVSGKWTAEFQGPQGNPIQTTFDLKVDGNSVSGTVKGIRGGETPISDGKLDGDNLSFSVVRTWQGNEMKMLYKGKINGDSIHFTVTREGGEGRSREFEAKRSAT